MKFVVCFLVAAAQFVSATGPSSKADKSLAYLLRQAKASPNGVDPAFDCEWRRFAALHAVQIQPWLSPDQNKQLFDALQLAALCNDTFSVPKPRSATSIPLRVALQESPCDTAHMSVFVSPNGSDANDGSFQHPLQTLAAAVNLTRRSRNDPGAQHARIVLRQGVYFVAETVQLGADDSFLAICSFPGEQATLSGGVQVSGLHWTPTGAGSTILQAALPRAQLPVGVTALHVNGLRATRARFPNANAEIDLFPTGYVMAAQAWTRPQYRGQTCDSDMQCGTSVNVTIAVNDAWHGMYQNWTVGYGGTCEQYDPPYSPWCSGDFYLERQFPEMHTRHPAGITTASLPHVPYKQAEGGLIHAWRPGHWYTWMFEVASASYTNQSDHWNVDQDQNNIYGLIPTPGSNSSEIQYLGDFDTAIQCFAACNATRGCTAWTFHEPSFDQPPAFARGCYQRISGIWDPTQQSKVTSGYFDHGGNATFTFGAGGTQGGEGSDTAAEWFIENIFEELDAENEFYYDEDSEILYFWYNGTGPAPSMVVVPTLATIVQAAGSQEAPVVNLTLSGLVFTATRPTFMDPRSNPSGGDWSLERSGAVLLQGTIGATVANCTFVRLDSNALFLSGFNRNCLIAQNQFSWLGQSAIAAWGFTIYNDGTNGDQPRGTVVWGNWIHEIGHYQKQSSCYFQAESAQTLLSSNICFNIPRAGINFNDGFGGGNELDSNLLFNTCRESSDHGAFNSWDRLPYITDVADGHTPSTVPALNDVHHNFIVANYAADGGCLDNDDGSAYYNIHHNFCVYGGHKSDFDGHSKTSAFNLHVYPNVYGTTCLRISAQVLPPSGYAESYHSNRCILPNQGNEYLAVQDIPSGHGHCLDGSAASFQAFIDGLKLGNNTIYAPQASVTISCGGKSLSMAQFQSLGFDLSSTVSADMPSATTIIQWGRELLYHR